MTESRSERFGVTSRSNTVSPRKSASGIPSAASRGNTIMPSWLWEMPNSFSEQTIPHEVTPRILAGLSTIFCPLWPSISSAPVRAKAILSPNSRLGAPQTTVCLSSTMSTVTRRRRSASGWGSIATICPTTTPCQLCPSDSRLVSVPAMVSRRATSARGRSILTYSLSHLTGTFISLKTASKI